VIKTDTGHHIGVASNLSRLKSESTQTQIYSYMLVSDQNWLTVAKRALQVEH
jgi:hypothetical protein